MNLSRRDFLRYCGAAAAMIGLNSGDLSRLAAALQAPDLPHFVWLHGSGCQGDSISLLNRIAPGGPAATFDDLLVNAINLDYHAVAMTVAGESAAASAMRMRRAGNYYFVVEGGIPTAFDGNACGIWTYNGREVNLLEATLDFAKGAKGLIAVGTCAAFGGVSAAPPNPSGVLGFQELLDTHGMPGRTVVNITGCPTHPDWVVGTLVKVILGEPLPLDEFNRPTWIYGTNVHDNCPRNASAPSHLGFATTFGQDGFCLENLGCRGPETFSDCPSRKWNNAQNWCVDSNGMCLGCTAPTFPGGSLYEVGTLTNPGPLRPAAKRTTS